MSNPSLLDSREACPCCSYPTLTSLGSYQVCELCFWEDDGQGDAEANKVWGGPNADYSLAEARQNFLQHRTMYSAVRDEKIVTAMTPLEYETKGLLMAAFAKLHSVGQSQSEVEAEILLLEKLLSVGARPIFLRRARRANTQGLQPVLND